MKFPRLIGVIHLPALAGAPKAGNANPAQLLRRAREIALRETQVLARAGFDGLILENFGDAPFYKDRVTPETVASLAVVAAAVRETTNLSLGVNVLRNDSFSALAIASVTECDWIRVNVLSGVVASDQGIIEGQAASLLRERSRLGSSVSIFADVQVKHARSLSGEDLDLAIEEAAHRGMADAVVVTGATTGRLMPMEELKIAADSSRRAGVPLFLGSGATVDQLEALLPWVDGVLVGSALRQGGRAGEVLDPTRVQDFAKKFLGLKSVSRGNP